MCWNVNDPTKNPLFGVLTAVMLSIRNHNAHLHKVLLVLNSLAVAANCLQLSLLGELSMLLV